MKRSFLLLVMFLVVAPAYSQDLDRLLERVNLLWGERTKGDMVRASQYIETANRKDFPMYEKPKDVQVEGFLFSADRSKVLVTVRAKVVVPELGVDMKQVLSETWVFANGNWFLKPEVIENPFASEGTAVRPVYKFELLDKKVDLGSHKQGEIITGSLRFAAPRAQVENIRGGPSNLRVKGVEWKDDNGGLIHFAIDTSLLFQDISQEVTFDAIRPFTGLEDRVISAKTLITAKIEGKVSIVQLPQSDAAKREGMVEVQIRNVGNTRVKVQRVSFNSSAVSLDGEGDLLPALDPGSSATLPVYYVNKVAPTDVELTFRFEPGVLPNNFLIFRLADLKADAAAAAKAALTREQLDKQIKQLNQQSPEIQQLQQQIQQQQNQQNQNRK